MENQYVKIIDNVKAQIFFLLNDIVKTIVFLLYAPDSEKHCWNNKIIGITCFLIMVTLLVEKEPRGAIL